MHHEVDLLLPHRFWFFEISVGFSVTSARKAHCNKSDSVDMAPFVIDEYSNIILLVHINLWTSNFLQKLFRDATDTYFSPTSLFLIKRSENNATKTLEKTLIFVVLKFFWNELFSDIFFMRVLPGSV